MRKILIIFAHPALEKSRVHAGLLRGIGGLENVTLNDLYQNYPEFDIDVEREQALLLAHDIIIWQHPLYWYSAPAILKQWQDIVLEHGWAYGRYGKALTGKIIFNVFTSGGPQESYKADGYHNFTIQEFLRPFQKTAELCRMIYWPPFWIAGTHGMNNKEMEAHAIRYRDLLVSLTREDVSLESVKEVVFLNDILQTNKIIQT